MDTELGENKVMSLWDSGYNIDLCRDWLMHNLLWEFLFKDTLFNKHYWFINIELMATSTITWPERCLSNICIFSLRDIKPFCAQQH